MSKQNGSKYWDKAWTLVDGCTKCSPGCLNCWLESLSKRFYKTSFTGSYCKKGFNFSWNGRVQIREGNLALPQRTKKPTVWNIWGDLFHEKVPFEFICKTFTLIAKTSRHIYLILTKRPKQAKAYFDEYVGVYVGVPAKPIDFPLPNIWLGTTVCNQEEADKNIPILLQISRVEHRWLSIEPMLGEIKVCLNGISQVMIGCESGAGHRLCKLEWIESIVDQCKRAGVPCFVKQIDINGKVISDFNKFPKSVQVRESAWRQK